MGKKPEKPKLSTGHTYIDGLGLEPGSWQRTLFWIGFALAALSYIGIVVLVVYLKITGQMK